MNEKRGERRVCGFGGKTTGKSFKGSFEDERKTKRRERGDQRKREGKGQREKDEVEREQKPHTNTNRKKEKREGTIKCGFGFWVLGVVVKRREEEEGF